MYVFWYQFTTFIWKKYSKSKQTKYLGFVKLCFRWAERDIFSLKQFLVISMELEWPHCEWRWCLAYIYFWSNMALGHFPMVKSFSRHIVRRAVGAGEGLGAEGVPPLSFLQWTLSHPWGVIMPTTLMPSGFLDLPTALRHVFVPSSSFLPVPA